MMDNENVMDRITYHIDSADELDLDTKMFKFFSRGEGKVCDPLYIFMFSIYVEYFLRRMILWLHGLHLRVHIHIVHLLLLQRRIDLLVLILTLALVCITIIIAVDVTITITVRLPRLQQSHFCQSSEERILADLPRRSVVDGYSGSIDYGLWIGLYIYLYLETGISNAEYLHIVKYKYRY